MGCVPSSSSKKLSALVPNEFGFETRKPEKGRHPDHWFEINLTNKVLFPRISLSGVPDLLPGRLFTTRMPRDLAEDPSAKREFERKVEGHKLNAVLILTEKEEYNEYAKVDLEEFYESLGLEIMCYPIRDFDTPTVDEFTEMVKRATLALADGRNILVHCAGGNGRTGLLLCGILKTCGVENPIQVARKTKSTYVETPAQEKMVNDFPVIVPVADELCLKKPELAQLISLDKLLVEANHTAKLERSKRRYKARKMIAAGRRRIRKSEVRDTVVRGDVVAANRAPMRPAGEEEDGEEENDKSRQLQFANKYPSVQFRRAKQAFDLLDKNQDGRLSIREIQGVLNSLGASVSFGELLQMVNAYGSQEEKDPDRVTIDFQNFANVFLP